MQVRIPPGELTRGGVGDDGCAVDPPPCRRVVEALDHAVHQLADLPVEPPVVAEERAQHLGECEDDLAVREAQQQPLVHVLAEEQGSLLRA